MLLPIAIAALATVSKRKRDLTEACFLGTAGIIRKVMDTVNDLIDAHFLINAPSTLLKLYAPL